MAQWTIEEAKDVMDKASKRAATDMTFRSKLLSNPNTAVQEIAGKPIPPNVKVRILERQGYDFTLILPDSVGKGGELSDAQLEQVAGGKGSCLAASECNNSCNPGNSQPPA